MAKKAKPKKTKQLPQTLMLPSVISTKKFRLWSPSIVGAIYFDKKGNWWVYEEDQNQLYGASPSVRGITAPVIPSSYERDTRRIKAII